MSELKSLLDKFCSDGVKYIKIGEGPINITKGEQLNKDKLVENGKYPVINGGIKPSGYWNEFNTEANSIAISQGGASAGYVSFITTPFWAGAHCYVVKPNDNSLNNRFLYHALKNHQATIQGSKFGAGIPALNKSDIENLVIPFPLMEIQNEIARILDDFSALEAELEAELEARTKQYEYFRYKLLDFSNGSLGITKIDKKLMILCPKGVKYEFIGSVLNIKNGSDYKHLKTGNVPVYGTGGIMTYVDKFSYNKPSVLIPRKGSLSKLYYVEEPFWNVDTIFHTEINTKLVIPKYVFYYLQTQRLETLNTAGGVPSLTQTILNKIRIPIPPLEVQNDIVDILDQFNTYVTSITQGLPAEIKSRRQQYEFYRNKLLTF